jgi:O-antigen/teichoic acid export membrane protein
MLSVMLERTPIKQVARGGVAAFSIYSVAVGLAYGSQLLVARMVGVHTYGEYAYVFAWMTVLSYFSALGFDVALLRFVPAYEAKRMWPLFCGVIQYAERRSAAASVLVIVIGVCAVMLGDMSPQLRDAFLVGFLLVPVLSFLWIRCSCVRALGGVVSAVAPDRMVREGVLLSIVAVLSVGLGWHLSASEVMAATVTGAGVGLALASLGVQRRRPHQVYGVAPTYDAPTWRRAALPLVIIGAAEALMNRTGVILLGWLSDTKAAGIYSVVFNVAFVTALPRMAINTLFAPTISSLHVRKDKEMLQALITTAASWTLGAASCIAVVLLVLAEPLLAWFGPGYEAGVPALRILLIGQVIVASGGSQLYVMTMTGHERSAAALLVSSTIANAAGNIMLIGWFGLTGAAIGTAVALVGWNAVMAVFLWRRLSVLPGVLAMRRVMPLKRRVPLGSVCSDQVRNAPMTSNVPHHTWLRSVPSNERPRNSA